MRGKIRGTVERPRLVVFRSNRGIEAQLVDDDAHRTLAAASWLVGRRAGGGLADDRNAEASAHP